MAGSLPGGALNALGTALIPETMARLQMPALIDQAKREQQVGNIQAGRLLGGADAEIGTPQTKSYQVNGRTIGQDNPSTVKPLFSTAKKLALFSQVPEGARPLVASQIFPAKPEVKAYNPGQVVGTQSANGQFTPTYTVPTAPDLPKKGTTRVIQRGLENVTQEADGAGGWNEVGKGPTYKPDAPEKPKDTFDNEAKLRGEFDTKTKDFAVVRDAAATIQRVATSPSPAGDISLIFSYMKLLDPGSTVREGEYATAQNAASVPETIRAKFNKVMNGETLTPDQRDDFVFQANNVYTSKLGAFNNEFKRYSDLSNIYNVNPNRVVYDRTLGTLPGAQAPSAPGTAVAAQPASIPQTAIDYLKTNPALSQAFDQKYGAGSAAKYLGAK